MDGMLALTLNQVAIAKNLRPNTVKTYAARLTAIGATSDMTLDEAQAAIDAIDSINTRNSTAIAVRTVMELNVRLSVPVAREWSLPTSEQLKTALAGFRYETRAYLMAVTGVRLSESAAITKRSVQGNTLVVESQVNNQGQLVATKTKAHTATIPTWLADRVRQIETVDSPAAISSALQRLSKTHEVNLNAAALRSFSGNYLLSNGIDIHSISTNLGHGSIATTSKYYLVANRNKMCSVMDTLNPAA